MTGREGVLTVVREWLAKAENDLKNAAHYATGARYPGWGEISLAEARRAVTIARRIRRDVRKLLPIETLRRRRA
jgi:hypothetical protein